jgi:glycosyltransferase involved in cell wall biosynthesis
MGENLDGFIVQSESWGRFYAEIGVPRSKLHVWHNFVDVPAWGDVAASRSGPRVGSPFRFLFLGWATAEKGLPELIQAASQLAARPGPPFVLAVAGDGAVAHQLRHPEASAPDWLDLRGWLSGQALADELRRADALVLPSHAEGFPNVVLEAMASALPVLATSVGAIPEVIENGRSGILFEVRDVQGLAAALDTLRQDPHLAWRMGQRGLDLVREKFDRQAAIGRLVSILMSS